MKKVRVLEKGERTYQFTWSKTKENTELVNARP